MDKLSRGCATLAAILFDKISLAIILKITIAKLTFFIYFLRDQKITDQNIPIFLNITV